MRREIKFRAWDGKNKCWLPNEDIDIGVSSDGRVLVQAGMSGDWVQLEGHEHELGIMQYTGRKDGNGLEAYEGDIYHCGYEYQDGTHKYGDRNVIEDIRTFAPEDEFTIIGNIYENPDLIKQQANTPEEG